MNAKPIAVIVALLAAGASLMAHQARPLSPAGNASVRVLGTIPTPVGMQSVGFAGGDKKTMFAVGRGAAYRIAMRAEGITSRAK